MRKLLLIITVFVLSHQSFANHITGGQIYYTLASQSGNSFTYSVTLLLYRDSLSTGAQLDPSAPIAIFDRATGAMVWSNSIPIAFIEVQHLWSPDPCINNPPTVIYQVGHYSFSVTLQGNPNGYIISYQRCCRIAGINNIGGTSSSVGATYTAEIPGTSPLATAPDNNSAHFIGPDTVVVCQHNSFTYSFNAFDGDGDSLTYNFCNAYTCQNNPPNPNPPAAPPYQSIPYAFPFSGGQPMGPGVSVNSNTGIMSGIAPDAGIYVVTVCVNEYRNGILIATQRKDLQIKVGDCSIAAVNLDPTYITCDGYSWTFFNQGDQTLIQSYFWNFGDPASGTNDSSALASPTHVFSDTGVFVVSLITNRNQPCSDTGITIMKVYPGFFPGFTFSGICANKPTQFTDTTRTQYGVVNTWRWDFGVLPLTNDTSHLKNPAYTYTSVGTYNVQFIVSNSKGCVDTVMKPIDILDKPPLNLAFRDTLICRGDNVQLQAIGNGIFSWTPLTNISNANTPTPTVNPPNTATYFVNLDDNGCINRDSVRVRVVAFVSVNATGDTTICQGDVAFLNANSDALRFTWSPAAPLNNPNIINPVAVVNATTTFQLTGFIGSCSASDFVTVRTVPYPVANAGADTNICFNSAAQLHASIVASSFSWSPAGTLNNPSVLNPIATPSRTTAYILTVLDNLGCPKPGKDTVIVIVRPKVNAFAGNDTAVVVGQPLNFNATGGINYVWSPPTGLNNFNIHNPVAIYDGSIDSIRYRVLVADELNCIDSAFIVVRIFKTNPRIFVPTAFTPNDDGLNDVFRPLGVGIKQIEYFRVFNRWGQLVFSTTINGHGWDGRISGKMQSTNTYVWIVKGIDYLDKPFFAKGTVTLIH